MNKIKIKKKKKAVEREVMKAIEMQIYFIYIYQMRKQRIKKRSALFT